MKDIEVDEEGRQRCWNCGGMNFTQQRTARSKVAFGVGALLTKKKLRCVHCGEYSDVGNAKPYRGPAGRKYKGEWEAEQARAKASPSPPPPPPPPSQSADDKVTRLKELAALKEQGAITEEEFDRLKAEVISSGP
jgi:putative oligomerization/nucleic acid binding protein